MKHILLLPAFLSLILNSLYAQLDALDSLQKELQTCKVDSERVQILSNIGEIIFFSKPDEALALWNEALTLSEKTNYPDGVYMIYALKANYYNFIDDYDEANKHINYVLQNTNKINNKEVEFFAYAYYSMILINKGHTDSAFAYINKAKLLADALQDKRLQAVSHIYTGLYSLYNRNFNASLASYQKALEYLPDSGEENTLLACYAGIASVYYNIQKHTEAEQYITKALSLTNEYSSPEIIANINFYKGAILVSKKSLSEAIPYLDNSISFYKEIKDKQGEALAYIFLSQIYRAWFQPDKAIEYGIKSYQLLLEIENNMMIGPSLATISSAYFLKKDYQNVNHYDQMAVIANAKTGIELYNLPVYVRKALICAEQKEIDSAYYFIQKSEPLFNQFILIGDRQSTYFRNKTLATIYLHEGKLNMADSIAQIAYKFIQAEKGFSEQYMCSELLYDINIARKDFEKALQYKILQAQYLDSIKNERDGYELNNFYVKYQTAEKDKEILKLNFENELANKTANINLLNFLNEQILRQNTQLVNDSLFTSSLLQQQQLALSEQEKEIAEQNETQAKADAALQKQIAENERLQKIEKTRTINFLILSILFIFIITYILYKRRADKVKLEQKELEVRNYQTQVDPHSLSNMLQDLRSAIIKNPTQAEIYCQHLASLQRDITKYADPKCVSISLEKELETVEKYMKIQREIGAKNFSYTINLASDIDAEIIHVPPLFLRPLVENAITHGIKNLDYPGEIEINISKAKKGIAYSVKDNGRGFIKTPEYFSVVKNSFGLQNTKERIAYLCKKYKIKNDFSIEAQQPGTIIKFVLPPLKAA